MDGIASFGYWVRRRRKALDLTQATLARQVGCSVSTIRKIERDERRPSRQIARLLADHLDIPPEEQDNFLRMSRGEFVSVMPSPLESVPSPTFFQQRDDRPEAEETRFVAREKELEQLNAFLDRALAGQGQVAFVVGGPGRGKTALVEAFTRQALENQADLATATGYCNAYSGVGDAYLPFREILGLLTGDVETRWAAGAIGPAQAQRLWNLMPYTIQTLVSTGPDLIDTFIPGAGLMTRAAAAAPEGASWLAQLGALVAAKSAGQGPGELKQSDLFEQYVKVMLALTQQGPLLLVLEDMQWADSGSISLLFHLGRRLHGHRILVIGIYRPVEVAMGRQGERHPLAPLVSEFQRHFGQIQIDLSRAEGRQFVTALLDTEPNRLDKTFQEAFYKHTQGHALFTVEILRGLQERGNLVHDEAGHWVEGAPIRWEQLPARVEGIIGERLGRLPSDLFEMLKVASVMGDEFVAEVVAKIINSNERQVIRQLSGPLDKQYHLVRSQRSHKLGAQRLSHYRFHHILFQTYLYNTLDDVERTYLHGDVAHTLEQIYGDRNEDVAVQLGHHFALAGDDRQARKYFTLAGKQNAARYANVEAVSHYSRALELTPENNLEERYDLLLARSGLYDWLGEREAQGNDLMTLRAITEQLGDGRRQAGVALHQAKLYNVMGDHPTGIAYGYEAIDLAHDSQATELEATGYYYTGWGVWKHEGNKTGRPLLERALSLARSVQFRWAETESLRDLGQILREQGDYTEAIAYLEQALQIGRETDDRKNEGYALDGLGKTFMLLGNYPEARVSLEQGLHLMREIGYRQGQGALLADLGWVFNEQEEYAEAMDYFEQSLRISQELNALWVEGPGLVGRGYAQLGLGALGQATSTFQQVMDLGQKSGDQQLVVQALAGLAQIALAQKDLTQAQRHIEKILSRLENVTLYEPFRTYLTCYKVLDANNDDRAGAILTTAHTLLQKQAAKINDETIRRSFLENVKANREIAKEWKRLHQDR